MNIENAAKQAIELIGKKAVELIKSRIQSQGKNADDSYFSPYSTEYKKVRNRNSRQIVFKDFTFSGKMFENFKVQGIGFENNIAFVEIGMSDEKYQKIVANHSNKEGKELIELSENEQRAVFQMFDSEFQRILGL